MFWYNVDTCTLTMTHYSEIQMVIEEAAENHKNAIDEAIEKFREEIQEEMAVERISLNKRMKRVEEEIMEMEQQWSDVSSILGSFALTIPLFVSFVTCMYT